MKLIKEELYNKHNIRIYAKYKEVSETPESRLSSAATAWGTTNTFKTIPLEKEVIEIELEVFKDHGNSIVIGVIKPVHKEEIIIKELKGNKDKLHEKLVAEIDRIFTKAKKLVDQIEKEKEITNGLPDSLLKDEKTDQSEKEENSIYDAVYEVCIQAIEDMDTKKTIEFIKTLNDRLKRNQGMR